MASPHLAEQVGRVLDGRYRVVAPIGTGASAAVYLADDVVLRRRVALKVLHAALAGDQGFLKRFQAEAHTAAALSHPNIMRVLDWGEAEDGPFLVLEYLGGGSLRAVLDRETPLTVEQAVSAGLQAARALDYAHRRGLVHRDIKPANLLFDDEGRLAIADFGLARALAEAAWTEPGGSVLGTARYASPEQVRGKSLDGNSDVYALGLVLVETVTGAVPFTADTTIATLMARLDASYTAPQNMGPLGPIVERLVQPDPTLRPTAGELVAILEEAADSLPHPEKLHLPGAVVIDITKAGSSDPTMLPGIAAPSAYATAAVETPMPLPQRRGLLRRRHREPRPETAPITADSLPTTVPAAANPTAAQPSRPSQPSQLTRSHVTKALLVVLLVAVLGAGGYTLYFFTGQTRPVPVVQAMSVDAARAAAHTAHIKLMFDSPEYNETVPAGQTFGQAPAPGTGVHPRQAVHVRVSKGPAPRAVPEVNGQQLSTARAALNGAGFTVTTEDRYDEQAPVGKVLEVHPDTGLQPKGTKIHLVVSGGPAPRTLPDLSGSTYDGAVAALTQLQLKVSRTDDFSDTVPVGQVSGTHPGPGASVPRDSTVAIVVSKGQDLVTVPDVTGMSLPDAQAALQSAGLTVNVYGRTAGAVRAMDPQPGGKVKRGSSVTIALL